MQKNNCEIIQKLLLGWTNQSKSKINDDIIKLFQSLTQNKSYISKEELEKLLNDILNKLNIEMDKLINNILKAKEIVNSNDINNKTKHNIESNSELNVFTSKDIQEENKEITRNFQNETYNYMNTNEKVENESAAKFLRYVAQISRISYNVSQKLLKKMEDNFAKLKGNTFSFKDINSKKEFSFWIKNSEKENQIKEKNKFKEYLNILNGENLFKEDENSKEQKYLLNLYYDLSIMYFHCHIAFPLVEIDFKAEENFNSEKMIDFINRGKNRKVNFVILPALISNSGFLQNGKQWVFTFYKNTFKFEDTITKSLNNLLNIENINAKYIQDNLKINIICRIKDKEKEFNIITNIDIPEDIEYEFKFYFLRKKDNKIFYFRTKKKHFRINKSCEITKYEFKIEDKIILTSKDIKIER